MEEKLQLFYNSLTANPNIKGLPDDFDVFRTTLADPAKSELFFNSLKANPNIKGLPDNYNDFVNGLALNSGGIGQEPESPEPQQEQRPGFLEGLNKKFASSIYGAGEAITESPQFGESVKQFGVKTLADAYINRLVKKGKITAQQAEIEKQRTDTYLPKIDFLGAPHKATTEKLPGAKLADSDFNKWLSETSERLSKEGGARYEKRVVDYLKEGQFGKALGAEIYGITESLAPTLLAALGGPVGAGALGVMTGAETYDEVKDRDDMQEAAKVIDGLSTGMFEALFEYLGTAEMTRWLKNKYSSHTKNQVEEALKGTLGGLLSKAYKRFGVWFAPVHEGLSEGLTTLGQNATAKFTGEDPERKLNDNFIESVLIGMGMGGVFAGTEKGLETLARKFKGTPVDQGPAAIGELKVPYTQEQAAEIINNIGRDLKFGDTPLEEDPSPMISFAQTMIGQKVILKKEGGIKGDDFFIAFDLETNEPVLVKAKDIKERKDVPYQEWFNNELQNYNIVKSQADNMAAQMEAPVQPGQEITLKDKNFYVSEVTPEGIVLNEIDEEGNISGAALQITPDQYNTVFGTGEGIQETENLPENELPSAMGEGIQAAPEAPGARTLTVGKTNYSVVPDETGILTIDQVFTDEAVAKNVVKALEKGYPKASFSLQKTEFEDFLTPDEYRITVQPKKAKAEPAKPEGKAEKPAEPEKVEPVKVVGKNEKGEEIRVGDEIGYQWRDGFITKPGKVIGVEHDPGSNVTWVKTDGPEGENKLNISVAQVVKPEEPVKEELAPASLSVIDEAEAPSKESGDNGSANIAPESKSASPEHSEAIQQGITKDKDNGKTNINIEDYEISSDKINDAVLDIKIGVGFRLGSYAMTSGYMRLGDTVLRIKDHSPEWAYFGEDIEDRGIKRVVNVTVGNYRNKNYRNVSKISMEVMESKYPDVEFIDIKIEDGETISSAISQIKKAIGQPITEQTPSTPDETAPEEVKQKAGEVEKPTKKEEKPKESWQMTREEFWNHPDAQRIYGKLEGKDKDAYLSLHKVAVEEALVAGKSVPPEVLADYPELLKPSADLTKANSEVDTQPTEAQKEAGNYKKGHLLVQGFDISIENPSGSVRTGTDKTGKKWSQKLNNSYGYFRRTKGKDGDQVDVFLGDNLTSDSVYVIDQVDPQTGLFDEHKVMFGFNSAQDAKDNYYGNYEPGWKGLGAISKMSIDQFKDWLGSGTRTKKPVDGNVPVQKKAETKPAETVPTETNQVWSGIVDLRDGSIGRTFTLQQAKDADFHHSFLVEREEEEAISNGEKAYFWIDKNGEPQNRDNTLSRSIKQNIKDELGIGSKTKPKSAEFAGDLFAKKEEGKAEPEKPKYGESNKIFTADAAQKAREILKRKLNQLNAGFDPELMTAGFTLAGYHVEAGARKFADFAKAMIEDIGVNIKPHLKGFYHNLLRSPYMTEFVKDMDTAEYVDAADIDNLDSKPAERKPDTEAFTNHMYSTVASKGEIIQQIEDNATTGNHRIAVFHKVKDLVTDFYIKHLDNIVKDYGPVELSDDLFNNITDRILKKYESLIKPAEKKPEFAGQVIDYPGPKSTFQYVQISDKAFVVKGDTRPIKDQLKRLGGLWNGKYGGWIFRLSKLDTIRDILGLGQLDTHSILGGKPTEEAKKPEPAGQSIEQRNQRNHRVFVVKADGSPTLTWDTLTEQEAEQKYDELIGDLNNEIVTWDKTVYNKYGKLESRPTVRIATPAKSMREIQGIFSGITNKISRTAEKREKLINSIKDSLAQGNKITNSPQLVALAEKAGMKAGEDYQSIKELYDIAGLALNRYIMDSGDRFSPLDKTPEQAKQIVEDLIDLQDLLPTETQRSATQVDLQQYSTPPALAFLVNWTAGITQTDTVLEPSAGEGNIAVFASLVPVTRVVVNEIDQTRADLLKTLGFHKVTQEDAKILHAVNSLKDEKVTVVVMNPPFSRDVALGGKLDLHAAEKHLDAALEKLEEGGRLVAIVGKGMSLSSPTHKPWWDTIRLEYNVRANILISGDAYIKKGTSFDNRILVIDKTGLTTGKPVENFVADYQNLVDILADIPKNIRKFNIENKEDERVTGNRKDEAGQTGDVLQPKSTSTPTADVSGVQRGDTGRPGPEHVRPGRPGTGSTGTLDLFGQGSTGNVTANKTGQNTGDKGQAPKAKQGGRNKGITDNGSSLGRTEPDIRPLSQSIENRPGREIQGGGISVIRTEKKASKNLETISYDEYSPEISVKGAKTHPTKLVESSAMASVSLPETDYTPNLSQDVIDKGALSAAQIEDIILAGNAHKQTLPNGDRRGFFLGAGTGYGKGRTIAGILLDNWNKGSKKAVWISKNNKAHRDSPDYWDAVGGDKSKLFAQKNARNPINVDEGVLMTTYSTLRSGFDPVIARRRAQSGEIDPAYWTEPHTNRVQQLAQWLGKDFDGVIIFDESHEMANASAIKGQRGMKQASLQALAGMELQRILPKAKIVYSSATGATEVSNFTYAQRLGLWGDGTSFGTPQDFIQAVENSGVAGMEIISKDLKAMGLYTAKQLSFDGVSYDQVKHTLSPEQIALYDKVADAWQIVLKNINASLDDNNTSKQAKTAALSAFWGAHQRFFSQIITTMEMPTIIQDMQKQLDNGNSVVVQMVNTGEAQFNRAIAEARSKAKENDEEVDFEELDLSPKATLVEFLRNSYPVALFEDRVDDQGNTIKVMVRDSEGKPVLNPASVRKRDKLIVDIERELTLPESPLDILLNTFGADNIAEVTGRTKRVVAKLNNEGQITKQEETRSDSKVKQETSEFMDGKRRLLVFSMAGGTGASFHSDLTRKNQQQRVHYILQAGWRADSAIQGFGRSHRSNQRVAPVFKLVTTDLKAQMRFLSSIARRLEQLGALTKGQRDTGGQGVLDGSYNLENKYAKQALFQFYQDVEFGKVPGVDMQVLEDQMALKIYRETPDGGREYNQDVVFNTKTFLNRIMSLRVDLMNNVFDGFIQRLNEEINNAVLSGSYDAGIESVKAENIKVINEQPIYTDPITKGKTYLTTFELTLKNKKRDWETINNDVQRYGDKFKGFYQEETSGKIYAIIEQRIMDADGFAETKYKRMSVVADSFVERRDLSAKYSELDSNAAKDIWNTEFVNYPDTRKKTETIVKGLILPIWNKLPDNINVRRYIDENGVAHLGRFFNAKEIQRITEQFDIENTQKYSSQQIKEIIKEGGMVRMSNGFEFTKGKYQGLSVVKINNTTVYRDRDRLERAGVMFAVTSSLSMRGDFYIPMDRFADVFPNIESMFNSSVVHAQDSDGNFVIATQANSGENNVSLVNDEAEAYIKKNEVYAQAAPDKDWPEGVSHVSERARGTIPGQINLFGENDYSFTPGRGDATYAERIISNKGKLEFIGAKLTGPPEIKSPEDVAFLFKNLESAATENAFVVLIDKDNKYKVLYLSTGRTNATIVDIKLVAAAAQEFNAQSVCFVHNHPSGSLNASQADMDVHRKMEAALKPFDIVLEDSIIIDLDSGKYGVFSQKDYYETDFKYRESQLREPQEKVDVYQFDRQKLYTPKTEMTWIKQSNDVAEYLSKMKRGATPKLHAIILNNQNRITRYVLYDETINREDLIKELIYEIGKHGESVILASNTAPAYGFTQAINKGLSNIGGQLLDYIHIKQSDDIVNNYDSMGDMGLLEPKEEYKTGKTEVNDPKFAGDYLESNLLTNAAQTYREKKARRTIDETKQGIREYIQDLNLPIRKFEEEVLKRGGKQDNSSKPYRDTSLSFGRQEKLYNDFFDQKMKPVLAAVANIKKSGVSGEEVLPYIICKHAIERNRAFREKELNDFIESHPDAGPDKINDFQEKIKDKDYSGVMAFDTEGKYTSPDELAKDIASEFESQVDKKLINDLWSNLREANSTILDTWEVGGQISTEQKQEYLAKFKYFVPLRGWRDGAAKELRYTKGQGFSHSLRHAEGRKSLADNPLAYILNVEFQAIAEQVTNEVNSSMLNLIIRNLGNNEIHELATLKKLYYLKVNLPDGSYEWEPTPTRPTAEQFANDEARTKIYREHERLRAPSQAREHEVIVQKPGGDMVMIFKGKNLSVAQSLNKQNYLYRTIFGNVHDARDINKAMAFLGNLNNMLKAAYTSWNVVFPFTNFMRDFQEASITQAIKQGNGLKVIRNYKHTFPAIIRQTTGRQNLNNPIDRSLDEFYKAGGATGYTHLKTPEEIEKDINKEIKRMVRAGTLRGDMANTAHKFLLGIENWNRIFEDATRFSVYLASLSAGNTKEDAASDAKEASVNFNRKGKGSKAWDAYFAFFNVALQSMQKNFSLAKNYTGKFSAVALSFVTLGFLEAMMNALFDDDEDTSYYNINPYMRQNYLLIPNIPALIKGESKGDKYLSIPLPQFWRGFKSMGAIGFDIATKRMNVKDGIMHALGNFGSSLLPVDIGGFWKSGELSLAPIMPTVIKPITEVLENRNYMGYAIKNEPFTKDQEKVLARAGLGKKNVSPAAKFITDMLFRWGGGDSKYKYYYDSYQGRSRKVPGILDINPSTIEHLFKGYTGGTGAVFSDMITTISQGLSAEQEIDYRNAPFVNKFIRKIPEAKWNVISEYYDLRDDSKITSDLSTNYFKEGQYEKALEIMGDEYLMKYVETFKHYESALDDAKKDTDFDEVEGNYRGIELMRQCISDIKDLKEQFGRK